MPYNIITNNELNRALDQLDNERADLERRFKVRMDELQNKEKEIDKKIDILNLMIKKAQDDINILYGKVT